VKSGSSLLMFMMSLREQSVLRTSCFILLYRRKDLQRVGHLSATEERMDGGERKRRKSEDVKDMTEKYGWASIFNFFKRGMRL